MAKDIAAFGLCPDRDTLDRAVDALRVAGFRKSDVSVLLPETLGNKDIGHEAHTKAPEGTTVGATTGAVVGGALGWLVGLGALAIPGLGPLVAAGPLVSALAGAGAAGATGGIIGALVGYGIPEYEAKLYEGRIRQGHILLSVHCDDRDWARRAKETLRTAGATDVATSGESAADYHP